MTDDDAPAALPAVDHWHYWPTEEAAYGCDYAGACPLPHRLDVREVES